jgi:Transcription factor WhiB
MIPVPVADLLDTLGRSIPNLPGAACRGHPELFNVADRHDHQAIAQAKAVCVSCPALRGCRTWLASLPRPMRPSGVIAARYVAPPRLPPAYEPRPRAPSSRDRATDWLRGYLAARGPVLSTEVIADAAAAGFSCSTLCKARIALNVRLGFGCRCAAHVVDVSARFCRPGPLIPASGEDPCIEPPACRGRLSSDFVPPLV